MKPIILRQHEVVRLRDHGSVIAWRVVKPQPPGGIGGISCKSFHPIFVTKRGVEVPGQLVFGAYDEDGEWGCKCPYGRTGEERWVKETFARIGIEGRGVATVFRASGEFDSGKWDMPQSEWKGWRPSTQMPRWASRFTVTLDVGVKRIQEVTEEEAKMSGVQYILPVDVRRMPYPTKEIQGQLAATIESHTKGSWDRNDYFWKITCTLKK